MTLSYREKILVILLLVVAVLYIGIKFLIMPVYDSYTKNQISLSDISNKKSVVENNVIIASNINKSLQEAQKKALDIAKPFFPTLDSDILNLWVANIVASKGLIIQQINITEPKVIDIQKPASQMQATSYPINDFANIIKDIKNNIPSAASNNANSKISQSAVIMSEITLTMKDQNNAMPNTRGFLDAIIAQKRTVNVVSFSVARNEKNEMVFTCTLDCYAVQKLDDSDNLVDWTLPAPQGNPFS